jgi:hypothetical protein
VKRVNARWWTSFAIFAALGLAWMLATPLMTGPDEPAHVVRAASVGRSELLGRSVPKALQVAPIGNAAVIVTAPGIYKDAGNVTCVAMHKKRTAGCLNLSGTRNEVRQQTYVGHHPPAYYGFVGFFSRIVRPGATQIYLMRALGMLVIAALLASSLESLRRTLVPMWAATGLAIAVSPMVLFLAGTVSPSGVEVGAAIGVWVSGAVLAREADVVVDRRLVDRVGIAMCILVLSRALSPLWLGLIGLVLLILTTRPGLVALARSHRVWGWGGALAACSVFQLWWYVHASPLSHFVGYPFHGSGVQLVRISLGKSGEMLREMIGVFGWLDTRAPGFTLLVWVLALGGIATLALGVASTRFVLALLAATAVIVVVPVLVEAAGAHEAGFIWQGRYSLPLGVGVPIIAGIGVGSSEGAKRLGRRLGIVLVVGLGAAQLLAFAAAVHRYAVGANGIIWFFPDAKWTPPVPSLLLIVGFGVAVFVGLWWMVLAPASRFHREGDEPRESSVPRPPEPVPVVGDTPVTV